MADLPRNGPNPDARGSAEVAARISPTRRPDPILLIPAPTRDGPRPDPTETDQVAWYQAQSEFVVHLDELLRTQARCWHQRCPLRGSGPAWPWNAMCPSRGAPSAAMQCVAARRLLLALEDLERLLDEEDAEHDDPADLDYEPPSRGYHLIGHGYGGTILWTMLRLAVETGVELPKLRSWTTIAAPFPIHPPRWHGRSFDLIGLTAVLVGLVQVVRHRLTFGSSPPEFDGSIGSSLLQAFASCTTSDRICVVTWTSLGLCCAAIVAIGLAQLVEIRGAHRIASQAWSRFGSRWLGIYSPEDEVLDSPRDSNRDRGQSRTVSNSTRANRNRFGSEARQTSMSIRMPKGLVWAKRLACLVQNGILGQVAQLARTIRHLRGTHGLRNAPPSPNALPEPWECREPTFGETTIGPPRGPLPETLLKALHLRAVHQATARLGDRHATQTNDVRQDNPIHNGYMKTREIRNLIASWISKSSHQPLRFQSGPIISERSSWWLDGKLVHNPGPSRPSFLRPLSSPRPIVFMMGLILLGFLLLTFERSPNLSRPGQPPRAQRLDRPDHTSDHKDIRRSGITDAVLPQSSIWPPEKPSRKYDSVRSPTT